MGGRRRKSIWFVSPAYRRCDVTRLTLTQRNLVLDELRARGFDARSLIIADDENLTVAEELGCETLEYPNDPVGAKFNAGVRLACERGADYVVYIGSDDWVLPSLFDPLPFDGPWPVITGKRIGFVNLHTGRLAPCSTRSVIPWVIPREVLQPVAFEPVDGTLSRSLDGSLVRRLARAGVDVRWHFHDPHPLCRVDFKSETNITRYQLVRREFSAGNEREAWWPLVRAGYPVELVELAYQAHLDRQPKPPPEVVDGVAFRNLATGEVTVLERGSRRIQHFDNSAKWRRQTAAV